MINNAIRRRRGAVSDEVEALQTDVMRFLAIICMCLMIVFSLVQSLPMSGEENRPKITTREMIQKDIESLENRANQLKSILKNLAHAVVMKNEDMLRLSAKIADQEDRIEKLDEAAQKGAERVVKLQKEIFGIDNRVKLAMEKERQFQAMVENAKTALSERQTTLSRINALLDKGRRTLNEMETDVKEAEQTLKQLDFDELQLDKDHIASDEKDSELDKIAVPDAEKEGFTLGFESNETLLELLEQSGRVTLYMTSANRLWKLNIDTSGRVVFSPSSTRVKLYEMDKRTVPDKIIKAGRLVVAAFGISEVAYGVDLSSDISNRINHLMAGKKGGDLVITKGGEVSLE